MKPLYHSQCWWKQTLQFSINISDQHFKHHLNSSWHYQQRRCYRELRTTCNASIFSKIAIYSWKKYWVLISWWIAWLEDGQFSGNSRYSGHKLYLSRSWPRLFCWLRHFLPGNDLHIFLNCYSLLAAPWHLGYCTGYDWMPWNRFLCDFQT